MEVNTDFIQTLWKLYGVHVMCMKHENEGDCEYSHHGRKLWMVPMKAGMPPLYA